MTRGDTLARAPDEHPSGARVLPAAAAAPPLTRAAVLDVVADDPGLAALFAAVRGRHAAQPPDAAHDLEHLLRVARRTVRLAGDAAPARDAIAAALLHDLVALPKDHPDRPGASERSAAEARALLAANGWSAAAIDSIAAAIRDHSFSRGAVPADALGAALQDADRLDALGAIGLWRMLATGAALGRVLCDPEDPLAERRAPDEHAYIVDHAFVKLLRLPSTMRTAAGRAEAERRVGAIQLFLHALKDELGA